MTAEGSWQQQADVAVSVSWWGDQHMPPSLVAVVCCSRLHMQHACGLAVPGYRNRAAL